MERKTIGIIIVSILVLAGVGVGIYFLTKGEKCDPKCKDNAECKEKKCVCKDGFVKDASNNCVAKCSATTCGDKECKSTGLCGCKDGFIETNGTCMKQPKWITKSPGRQYTKDVATTVCIDAGFDGLCTKEQVKEFLPMCECGWVSDNKDKNGKYHSYYYMTQAALNKHAAGRCGGDKPGPRSCTSEEGAKHKADAYCC